MIIKVFY